MSRFITIKWIAFLLWQLMYFNFTNAEDDILNGMIKDNGNEIHLKWTKTKQLLANEHLPVWTADYAPNRGPVTHTLKPNFVKENVGEFIMYHDVEKSSAVVYFKKTQTLYGNIDTKYSIIGLPIAEINNVHLVGGPYVRKNEHPFIEHNKLKDSLIDSNKISETHPNTPSTSGQNEPPQKRPRLDNDDDRQKLVTMYPEILIFVPFQITEAIKHILPDYLTSIVRDHIIFFNSIDMLFAKLPTDDIKIHINIAGIVIDENSVLPMQRYHSQPSRFTDRIDGGLTMFYQQLYIKRHRELFVKDSFDFFFSSSFFQLQDASGIQEGRANEFDVYEGRLHEKYYGHVLGFLVHRGSPYDFAVAAHEIGHLMHLKHDNPDEGFSCDPLRCNAIMQPGGGSCQDCLKWSATSVTQLRKYVRYSRNHCFLLNRPRSLHPHGQPMKTLSPSDQCHCYGFDSYSPIENGNTLDAVSPAGCNSNMICSRGHHKRYVPFPVDGTPCDTDKVCWNEQCQVIGNTPYLYS